MGNRDLHFLQRSQNVSAAWRVILFLIIARGAALL